jgi:anti-sigma B factor antagonist
MSTEPSIDEQYGPLPRAMTVTVQHRGNSLVIVVVGDLAADTMVGLDPLVPALPRSVRHVVVDVTGVDFLDGAGLRALLHARTVCISHGATFTVQNPSLSSCYLMELTGTTDLLRPSDGTRTTAGNEQPTDPGDQERGADTREQHLYDRELLADQQDRLLKERQDRSPRIPSKE